MVIVVIPCRNEAATIGGLVRAALAHVDRVIVADDSSTDNTFEVARAAGASVVSVPASRNGLVGVYCYGLKVALDNSSSCDVIVEMDAGGSHDPADLPKLLRALNAASVATGSRFGGGCYKGAWTRKLLSYGGTALTNLRHGTSWHDATSGFVAYRRDALESLLASPYSSSGHYYQTEMRLRAHQFSLRMVEVPITYRNSSSSLNWRSIREALRLVMG